MTKNRRGATLTELMVAVVIMSIGILGIFGSFRYITTALHGSRTRTLAANLAQERIEYLKDLSYFSLLITTTSANLTVNGQTIVYDNGSYPPETISIGGVTFTRYTLVSMAQIFNDVISTVTYTYPDTGMKQLSVNIVWSDNGVSKVWTLSNLLENPNVNPLDSTLSGYAATTSGTKLSGVTVQLVQYPDYTTTTDSGGNYSFRVYHGTYSVLMANPGYYSWNSGVVQVPRGGTQVVNSSMTAIASGTVSGIAWTNPNLVISQVMVSSLEANGYIAQYVELYNPTTAQISIATPGGSPLVNLNFGSAANGGYSCNNIPMNTYVSTYVASNQYYLFANTTTFSIGGLNYAADAYYSNTANSSCTNLPASQWSSPGVRLIANYNHSGVFWLTDSGGNKIDAVGWMNGGANPNSCGAAGCACYGTCIPFNGGFPIGEQIVRVSSPAATLSAAAMTTYGRAYNSQNNQNDFFYPGASVLFSIQYPPKNTSSAAMVPIAGIPAVGAIVAATDANSGATTASAATISSGSLSLIYAPFALGGVSTGTWNVGAASGTAFALITGVSMPSQGSVIGIPNGATNPSSQASGLYHVQMTSQTTNGFIKGQIVDGAGNAVAGITVQGAGMTKTTDSNGLYVLAVTSGASTLIVNPNNANTNYVQAVYGITTYAGQVTTQNVVLTQGGTVTGYATTGTTPVPNFTVTANISGNQAGSAVTNTAGVFTLRNLSTGTYIIQPVLDIGQNASPSSQSATITSGQTVSVGTFTITGAFGTITGTITNGGAAVTSGALIVASTSSISSTPPSIAGSSAPALSPIYAVSSKSDGTYSLPVRGSYSYNLAVWVPTLNGTTSVTTTQKTYTGVSVSPGATTTQNLVLP